MKHAIVSFVGVVALSITGAALAKKASSVSEREYRRGYADCSAGRWDEYQHAESYKRGCRAAEEKRGGASGPSSPAATGPGAMMETCRTRAAKAYNTGADNVEAKYEGERTDGTHAVNGEIHTTQATFQCSFNRSGSRIVKFARNKAPTGPKGDALVPGTDFHATGEIPCAAGGGQAMASCRFGVTRRGNGDATVTVFLPDGGKRYIRFSNGKAVSSNASGVVTSEKSGDVSKVSIGAERYEIFDAVIFGG